VGQAAVTSTADFNYPLPPEAIAQQPMEPRDHCKLAVVDRSSGAVTHARFDGIGAFLRPGDLLVVNDSRVLPARIPTRRASGGAVEVFLLDPAREGAEHTAFLKPAHKLKDGERLAPDRDPQAGSFQLLARNPEGVFTMKWEGARPYGPELLESLGTMPLPPYIQRERLPQAEQAGLDREAYQTVYAREAGSVAAPTAGLHFTPELLQRLQAQGVGLASVTLHVGAGTFLPVKTDTLEEHPMHEEIYQVPAATRAALAATALAGGRVIAVGTTALRALESDARHPGPAGDEWRPTKLFLKPGDPFLAVQGLLTNFHQPQSTLLPLVCAFWNREGILKLYADCLDRQYRFLSYGDATLFM
jgi:S-adenosylmethionine:tRNA ribosyltransferase-isomerase